MKRELVGELGLVRPKPDPDGEAAQETGTSAPPMADSTQLRFAHLGWPQVNEHYRVSSFCWAMYLRLLRRHLEAGELVPYERRLEV